MKYVHRHLKRLDEVLYMYNITFCKDNGYIKILSLTLHAITTDGTVDHNVLPDNVEISADIKLAVLKMFIADGLIAV